jgi:hypothetical protein
MLASVSPNTSLHRTPAAAPPSPVSSKPLGLGRMSEALETAWVRPLGIIRA